MLKKIVMPKLSSTMESGTIEKWLKKEGDYIEKGEPLFEVTTEKVTMEVEAIYSGYLKKIVVKEGIDIQVSEPIAYFGDEHDKVDDMDMTVASEEAEPVPEKISTSSSKSAASGEVKMFEKIKSSPLAKKVQEKWE